MLDKLLLKTYFFILSTLSKYINELPENQFIFNDFLHLFVPPNLSTVSTKDFLKQIEDGYGFQTEISNKIQVENLYIDKTILFNSLSLILKPLKGNVFSVHYEEVREGSFLIPSLIFLSSTNPEKISKFTLISDFIPIETSLINDQWTRATNGGKIQIKNNLIIFRLSGLKLPDKKNNILNDIIPGSSIKTADEIENLIQKKLSEWNLSKIIDIQSFFNSIWNTLKIFVNKPERIELNIESSLPVFKLPELAFSSILLCAISPFFIHSDLKAGVSGISYDIKNRNLIIEIILKTDTLPEYPPNVYKILNYLMEQLNGRVNSETKQIKNDYVLTINIYIPDGIGTYLDNELPGWDYLSIESRDLLRRLSSDFSIPYDNPLISEILRYELENYFHNIFALPLCINLAHEVLEKDRRNINTPIKSILVDIEKGKLKKKSLNPVIIGQIIESFLNLPNGVERISKLFNNNTDCNIQLSELTQALKKFPQSAQQLLFLMISLFKNTK